MTAPEPVPALRLAWRAATPGLFTLAAYLVSSAAFSLGSRDGGLLTPEALPDPVVVVLGVLALTLRLCLIWVALPVGVWRLGRAIGRWWESRPEDPGY